jgi:hypothetical protein
MGRPISGLWLPLERYAAPILFVGVGWLVFRDSDSWSTKDWLQTIAYMLFFAAFLLMES